MAKKMADRVSEIKRSWIMSRVKGRDTKPELLVRSIIHRLGYRFRLHRRDLPGNPDIVLPKFKKIVFVHGCFWHQHHGCPRANRPSSNTKFWNLKLDSTIARDRENLQRLSELGWKSLIVWECETKDKDALRDRLISFIEKE